MPDETKPIPDHLPAPRRKRRGISALPTLFTLGNCLCGFASLHYAARGVGETLSTATTQPTPFASNYAIAGYFIFAAMLFDMFDGFVARLTRSTSDFGAELDSLADIVSFGVAPAFLALHLISDILAQRYSPETGRSYWEFLGPAADNHIGKLFWVIGAIYVCCTAMRLARFNVITKHDLDSHMSFKGLPSPGAGAVVASSIIFFETLFADQHVVWFNVSEPVKQMLRAWFAHAMPAILLLAALLMVSRFSYAHLINRFLRGRKRFRDVVALFLLVMLLVWQPQITALVAIYAYASSAPLMAALAKIWPAKPPAST